MKCICGAVVGRCIQHKTVEGDQSTTYRLAKYSIRPVSPSSELVDLPIHSETMLTFSI